MQSFANYYLTVTPILKIGDAINKKEKEKIINMTFMNKVYRMYHTFFLQTRLIPSFLHLILKLQKDDDKLWMTSALDHQCISFEIAQKS